MKRMLLTAAVTLIMTTALIAQRSPGRPARPGGDPAGALKDALGLTDAQVTAITSLVQAERPRMEAIRTEINQKRQALDALLSAATPVPVDVGNAAIALHASESKMKTQQDYLISQIKQQLTGDQQQKLDTLIAANGGRGLIPGLVGPGLDGPGPRGRGRRLQ
jgi:Spy/CpxP family protein refolding chaperone